MILEQLLFKARHLLSLSGKKQPVPTDLFAWGDAYFSRKYFAVNFDPDSANNGFNKVYFNRNISELLTPSHHSKPSLNFKNIDLTQILEEKDTVYYILKADKRKELKNDVLNINSIYMIIKQTEEGILSYAPSGIIIHANNPPLVVSIDEKKLILDDGSTHLLDYKN